jgi:hypothetical protein
MRYLKMTALSIVAILGCCAALATTAFAEGGPLYGFCAGASGGTLNAHCESGGSGFKEFLLRSPAETLSVLGLGLNTQKLKVPVLPTAEIACTSLHTAPGAYLVGGDPGKDVEELLYSGCTLPSSPKCDPTTAGEPLGAIRTNALESELVYLTEAGAIALNPDESGTLFRPKGGVPFVEIELQELEAKACPVKGKASVKGEVILKNDEPLKRELLHTLLAPETPIKSYYLGHTGTKDTIKKLEIAGSPAEYVGEVSVDVSLLGSGTLLAWWLCP